jgi:prevent-host-death family protein
MSTDSKPDPNLGSRPRGRGTKTVGVREARTHLSRLLRLVERGATITISRGGTPVARLVPLRRAPRVPGLLKGKIRISRDFDRPLPADLLARFRDDPS